VAASADLGTVRTGGGKVRSVDVSGRVPARASAVILAITTEGAKKSGGIRVWSAGGRPSGRSLDVLRRATNTDLALVSLDSRRVVNVIGRAAKGTASMRLVGVIK
jgi:hypothetical protein